MDRGEGPTSPCTTDYDTNFLKFVERLWRSRDCQQVHPPPPPQQPFTPPSNFSMLVCELQRGGGEKKKKSPGQPLSEAVGEQSKNRCGNSAGHIFNRVRKLLLWHLCHCLSCHRQGVKVHQQLHAVETPKKKKNNVSSHFEFPRTF